MILWSNSNKYPIKMPFALPPLHGISALKTLKALLTGGRWP
jgi:hypothetical protein